MKIRKFVAAVSFCAVTLIPVSNAFGNALLVEDILPWGFNSNAQTLTDIGISYDKINSSALATTDLSAYTFVVFASVQNQSFYDNIAADFSSVNSYVQNGGILIAHSALWGWPGNGLWNMPNYLPGGVDRVQEYSDAVEITDPSSPIVSGPYGSVSQSDFQGWNYTTHGYFTNLVAGTNVALDLNDPAKPIYIDYNWGAGEVRATMMTVEWGNNDINNTRYIFRENEFYAGQHIPPHQVPEPGSLALVLSSLIGIGIFAVRRTIKK